MTSLRQDLRLALARSRAKPAHLLAVSLILALGVGARLSAIGAALGLAGSLLLAPLVKSFLFEVGPQDPTTFTGVMTALAVVSASAAAIPAARASRANPAAVLRSE